MTSLSPDDGAFEEEREVRTDVRIAIELALEDLLKSNDPRDLTSYEEEKLTHFAIRDLDLPLTYSWYLAGAHTVARATPDERSPWQPGQAFGGINAQGSEYNDRIKRLREYFRSTEFMPGYTLRDVVFTDKFELLRDYYRELAPEPYRDLYVHSIDLREELWTLRDLIDRGSENHSLGDFGTGTGTPLLDPATERDIRYLVSDFHMDLAGIEALTRTKADVARGTDVIERILARLTDLETTTGEQQLLIQEVHDFFYYHVWKYPALGISADTATGPNADALQYKRLLEFDGFDTKLQAEVDDISQQARQVGLLPGADDLVSEPSEKSAYLHSLLKETVDDR